MRQAKSFIEVLEEQIREDLRDELRAELREELRAELLDHRSPGPKTKDHPAPGELSETWLAANVSKSFFRRAKIATSSYRKAATAAPKAEPHAKQESPERRPTEPVRMRAITSEELFALELLERTCGGKLPSCFSEAQLKTAWRRAALNTHPDRHTAADRETQKQMGETFAQIALAYDTLARLFR